MIYRIFIINLLDVVFILYIYCVNLVNLQIQSNDAGVIIQDERIIQCYNADYWNFPGTLEQLESNDTHFYTEELRQKFLKLAKTDGSESNPIILIQKMKK